MKEKDIRDDEIRVIGEDDKVKFNGWKWLLLLLAGIVIGFVVWALLPQKHEDPKEDPEQGVFEPGNDSVEPTIVKLPLAKAEETGKGFIEMMDTTINDIPMRLYLPHQVTMSLHVGNIDRNDHSIVFAAQAADIRADNGGIVGAFVLEGEPKAWGLSKKGYCAIINDTVTVGVADNSPLFEEATEKGGYFFRQFPLVDKGNLVENELKGKAVRRALCDRAGEIFTVETLSIESFHDFAQALVDLGVDNAIYLVGANAYGWATDADGQRHEFGDPNPKVSKKWRNINYLVMRKKP
jgi:hypothetical protein